MAQPNALKARKIKEGRVDCALLWNLISGLQLVHADGKGGNNSNSIAECRIGDKHRNSWNTFRGICGMGKMQLIVAITGASGTAYARMLLHSLPPEDVQIHLVASRAGRLVYGLELGKPLENDLPSGVAVYDENDFTAPFASGSFLSKGMAVVPCSMGTLAAIANGISQNLIHRAADVCLKERRRLVLVPRETPLNAIHLRNMLRLSQAGGIILPAMPGFYHQPRAVDDLVRFVVARVMEQFRIPHNLLPPWDPGSSPEISA